MWPFAKKPEKTEFVLKHEHLRELINGLLEDGTPRPYHGGCLSCTIFLMNEHRKARGREHCSGCRYYDADWSLPDKGIHVELGSGVHSAESVLQRLEEGMEKIDGK